MNTCILVEGLLWWWLVWFHLNSFLEFPFKSRSRLFSHLWLRCDDDHIAEGYTVELVKGVLQSVLYTEKLWSGLPCWFLVVLWEWWWDRFLNWTITTYNKFARYNFTTIIYFKHVNVWGLKEYKMGIWDVLFI